MLSAVPCVSLLQAMFWSNTAHSGLIGLNILGVPEDCTSVGGFTAMFHWNYAVFSSTASSLSVSHLKVAVGKVGLNLNVFGPDPVAHLVADKFVSIAGNTSQLSTTQTCGKLAL